MKPTPIDRIADLRKMAAVADAGLGAVLDSFRDAVLLVDHRGIVACANRSAEQLFQTPAVCLIGTDFLNLMADRKSHGFLDYLRGELLPRDAATLGATIELAGRQPGGVFVPIEVTSGRVVQPGDPAFTLVIRDTTERKAQEKLLRDSANRDPLTRVATRAHVEQLADVELFRASRYGRPLSVLLIDIDRFKKVNDTHGHAIGDHVLREVARRCKALIRASDLIGRWGGEEFLVMTPETAVDGGRALGERLRKTVVDQAVVLDTGESVPVAISIGIAQYLPSDADLTTIVARADEALYRAKANGRNRVEVAGQTPVGGTTGMVARSAA
ncbi:MAG: sensor domain-containing diguanylate cyclase [Alphaproteobacteria bacterium]|nr:sensor domain-containing diguanylate cyclase [Alphaproteobacteria bacterium]